MDQSGSSHVHWRTTDRYPSGRSSLEDAYVLVASDAGDGPVLVALHLFVAGLYVVDVLLGGSQPAPRAERAAPVAGPLTLVALQQQQALVHLLGTILPLLVQTYKNRQNLCESYASASWTLCSLCCGWSSKADLHSTRSSTKAGRASAAHACRLNAALSERETLNIRIGGNNLCWGWRQEVFQMWPSNEVPSVMGVVIARFQQFRRSS
jgi:hypothetical protein